MRWTIGVLVCSVSFLSLIPPLAAGGDGGMDDPGPCYAKVVSAADDGTGHFTVRFTAQSAALTRTLEALRAGRSGVA